MRDAVTVSDVDLYDSFGLILSSCSEGEPEPKTYEIDIPGGNGSIDLTEALSGDVVFTSRAFEFVFAFPDGRSILSSTLTRLRSFLHGRRLSFALSWDDGYQYVGRFSVLSTERIAKRAGIIRVSALTYPYKLKETCTYRVNAAGGITITLESGRMPVCPTFEFASETIVAMGDTHVQMQPGSYKVSDIWLHEGINELYLNSYLGDGNVSAAQYANDLIGVHTDKRISDLIWEGIRGAAVEIGDFAQDAISLHANERIVDTVYAVETDTEEFAVYINFDWKDL